MKLVVLGLLVIAAVFATENDDIALIHRIDATAFGKTLFDTITLQLQSGDPLDTLVSTLHDLEDRYVAEQKEADAANYDFQSACNSDIAAYDKDLAESTTKRIQLEAKLEGDLYPRRAIMTGIVNAKTQEVKNYQKQIDELDASRAEENADFEQKVREHEEATAIITEVRRLFESEMKGPSFLQKKASHTIATETISMVQKQMQDGLRRAHKFKFRKSFASIFKIFAGITSKAQQLANGGQLGRVIDLCNELLHKIEESLNLERFAEDKRVEAFKKARHLLVLSLTAANVDLANVSAELASINDQITQTETSLDNTNQRIDNLTEARNDRYNQCEEAAADYQDARASRDADRQVVSDCIGLVNTNLRTLKEQLALRLSAGDSFE